MSRRAIQSTTRTRQLLKSTEIEHPMTRHPRRHIPSTRKCLAVWRQCYAQQSLFRSYLPKNDAKTVLPYEYRFSGLHGPSPSPFLALIAICKYNDSYQKKKKLRQGFPYRVNYDTQHSECSTLKSSIHCRHQPTPQWSIDTSVVT